MRYAHESQSSTHNPTIYDYDFNFGTSYGFGTVSCSVALSAQNTDWPWQLDNRTGATYDPDTGTYFLPDYNGDLSYADDNIVEIDAQGHIVAVWEMDDEVGSNDSTGGGANWTKIIMRWRVGIAGRRKGQILMRIPVRKQQTQLKIPKKIDI